MRSKQKPKQETEIDVSFVKQNTHMAKQQQRLDIQIVRVHSIQKQRSLQQVWSMNQNQLCDFFTHYQLFPQPQFNLKDLVSSSKLKLIKSQGKIYFGEIHKKRREGKGIIVARDGKVYEGEFVNNQKNGMGIEIYANGNFYSGQYLNGKKHGDGKFYWFSFSSQNPKNDQFVQCYQGQWWGGLPDGHGLHQKLNGDLYVGNFKNGLKHQQGKQWYGNGDLYKGEFVNGMPEGAGEYQWEDGSSFKGDFKQGQRNGYGVWKANNGRLEAYKGHYSMDKKSGYGIYTWDNGWTYKGNFQNDYRNGYGELYDSQERLIYRGFWENGEQTDKEGVFSHKEKQINFRSMQMGRQQTRRSLWKELGDFSEKKSFKGSSKGYDRRFDMPEFATIGAHTDHLSKKRPMSHNSIKMRKGTLQSHNKPAKGGETTRYGSSTGSRALVGTIKSNLFVPYKHAGKLVF